MSFFNNRGGGNVVPGAIDCNPLNGIRHRVAVNVERILDSCMKQESAQQTKLLLSNITPTSPVPTQPLKFITAYSEQSTAIVSNLSISRLEERPEFARIKCQVIVPIQVVFEDNNNERFTAESSITIPIDVIMYVPKNSMFPFEIKATTAVNCKNGIQTGENEFTVTACYTVIMKVTAETDLLLPTYGFCPIPKAVDYAKDECSDFFDLPLYPSGK